MAIKRHKTTLKNFHKFIHIIIILASFNQTNAAINQTPFIINSFLIQRNY